MADVIDNLVQDINQNNTSVDAMYPLGYENYYVPRPDDFGVPQKPDQLGNQWKWDASNPAWGYYNYAQDLSNPSTLATGGEMDYNVRDQPVERINDGNTDEKDAFVRTGIGTTLDPKTEDRGVSTGIGTTLDPMTEDRYRFTGLIPPDKAGTFIGVQSLTKDETEKLIAGQTPSSLPESITTRGEPVGRTFEEFTQRPDYSVPIGVMADTGDIIMANRNNIGDTILVPSGRSISQADIDRGVLPNVTIPTNWNKGINTELDPSEKTPTSVGAYEGVGADQPTTTSQGEFENTGGNVTVGPDNRAAGPGGTINVTPGYIPKPEVKPGDEWDGNPATFKWTIATGGKGKDDGLSDYRDPKTGDLFPTDQEGYKWNYTTKQFDCVGGRCSEKNPVKDTGTTPAPGGGQPPTGGIKPGGVITGPGSGPGTYTGTPLPPREPVTPLVRRETVIPTKETKEVPLPNRQADPFAQIYADLLANAQQQKDQYRYINYDPDQIMNAAMSGFRRRGAMRSLQGY